MQSVVKAGVPVDVPGRFNWTPLAWVTVMGNLAGMKKLLELGANPNHMVDDEKSGSSNPLVMMIAQRRDPQRLQLLLEYGLDPNARWGSGKKHPFKGDSLLMESIMSKRCVERLVERGADVNMVMEIGRGTALVRAIDLGQLQIAEYLLKHGATVELDLAADALQNRLLSDTDYRLKILKMLKERGARIFPSKMYPDTRDELLQ